MALYLVVAEDGEGMWLGEPITADTLTDARIEAARQWPRVGTDACIVIYECREKEVFTPSPDQCKDAVSTRTGV